MELIARRISAADTQNQALTGFTVETCVLEEGDAVRLSSGERTLLAGVTAGADPAARTVGLTAEQLTELGCSDGDPVRVERVLAGPAAEVALKPLFGWQSERMFSQLKPMLVAVEAPVAPGFRFRGPVGAGASTGLFEVVAVAGLDEKLDVGRVTPKTKLAFVTPDAPNSGVPADGPELADVAGMHDALKSLTEAVAAPLLRPELYRRLGILPPRGVLLYGPPGVGKTYLARAIAVELGLPVFAASGPELVGATQGQTEASLRNLFMHAADHAPALVILDELDALAGRREHASSRADYRVVTQLLVLMDGLQQLDGVVVIATTNRPDDLDPALRRPGRLDIEIRVTPPNTVERTEILGHYLARMPLTAEAAAMLPDLATDTFGYLPADLMSLTRAAGMRALRRYVGTSRAPTAVDDDIAVGPDDLTWATTTIRPSRLRGFRVAPAASPRADPLPAGTLPGAARQALDRSGGRARVLLVGGGPHAQRDAVDAITRQLAAHAIQASPADLLTSWFGESEDAVRGVFEVAADVAPAVIELPHVDGIAPDRRLETSAASRRVVDQLLHELDAAAEGVHVVATTDQPELVDLSIRHRFIAVQLGDHIRAETVPSVTP